MSKAARADSSSSKQKKKGAEHFWFIVRNEVLKGPYTYEQVLADLAQGICEPGDYCWRQGYHEWRLLCSVEEFALSRKPYVVKSYPNLLVPSAERISPPSESWGQHAVRDRLLEKGREYQIRTAETKTVKVRLERQKSFQMGLWERTGMILFAMACAWAASWVALSEVEEQFRARYQRHLIGQVFHLGEEAHEAAQPSWTWQQFQPLLAAPGLESMDHLVWEIEVFHQESVVAPAEGSAKPTVLPTGHQSQWNSHHSVGLVLDSAIDPIYIQPYVTRGRWSLVDPSSIMSRTLGHPGL